SGWIHLSTLSNFAGPLHLSLVHTNKTLSRLKQQQLASWSDGRLQINSLEALAESAMTELRPLPKRPLI
ncbi:MAG: hypothetical protein V7730_15945, partial [Sulfitobacter sp.]